MRGRSPSAHAPRRTQELTALGPLAGEALRRALEEPAKAEGFRYEEGLLDEMTGAVEGERGARRDPSAPTGYKLDLGPSRGWRDVPTW
jgi:hypothetical protein